MVMGNSLNEAIIKIRVALQEKELKKTGKNKNAGFSYFELADFLPTLNKLMLSEGVNDRFYIKDNEAILELIKGEEIQVYTMPFVLFETPVYTKKDYDTGEIKVTKSMQDIQYLGAINTYYKRYLYINAFGITDGDVIDAMDDYNLGSKQEMLVKDSKDSTKLIGDFMDLLVESGHDLEELLKHYEVSKVEELNSVQYKQAMQVMKVKSQKRNPMLEEAEAEVNGTN